MEKEISIIIPAYNQEKYIGRCIRSVLDQFIFNIKYEIIVINDGSTDLTEYALKQLKNKFDEKIKVINNNKNYGLPESLNIGIKASTSEYIVRVDADDYVSKHFLNFLYLYKKEKKEYHAMSVDYHIVDEEENIIRTCDSQKEPIGCGILFKRDHLLSIGAYNKEFLRNEEKDLMLRFSKKYKVGRIDIPLYRYRRHDSNITNDKDLMNYYDAKLTENSKKV